MEYEYFIVPILPFFPPYNVLIFLKLVNVILNSQVTILLTHLIFFCTNSSCSSSGCSVFQVMMTVIIRIRMIMKKMIAISKQNTPLILFLICSLNQFFVSISEQQPFCRFQNMCRPDFSTFKGVALIGFYVFFFLPSIVGHIYGFFVLPI